LFAEVATRLLADHTDLTVGIAGDGVMREALETHFATYGLSSRVTFYGAVDQKTLAPLYAASFCYVHTAGWEGWGMPMIESIAAGCPVVTTDSGCAGEAIRQGATGLVTPVGDADALVAAVEELIGDPLLWERLVTAGRIEAREWSAVALSEKLMQWYGK
jgi:mannosyltransferase